MAEAPKSQKSQASSVMTFSVDIGDASIDSNIIRHKENRILYYNDQITELSRVHNIAESEFNISRHLNQYRQQMIEKRYSELDFRKQNLSLLQNQFDEASQQYDNAVAKKKTLLTQISRIHSTLKQTFERIERHVKKFENDKLSSDDDDDDGNSAATAESDNAIGSEKYDIMQKIKALKRRIVKAKFEHTKSDVSNLMLRVQKCELNSKISDLNNTLDSLKQRFQDCDKQIEEENKKQSEEIYNLKYEKEAATQAEQLADDAERSLNRSLLDNFSIETQQEYAYFKALVKQNKERKAQMKLRRAKLERATKRHNIRLKHGLIKSGPATPSPQKMKNNSMMLKIIDKRNRSVSPVRQSDKASTTSRRSRRSRIERRQIRIDIENGNIDDLEESNREQRENSEASYRQKIKKINDLNDRLADIANLKVQVAEARTRNQEEKDSLTDLQLELERMKKEKETILKKCQDMTHDMSSIEKADALQARKMQIEEDQRRLDSRKKSIDESKRKVDFSGEKMQTRADSIQAIDDKIKEIGEQIESSVQNVQNEVEYMLYGL